MITRPWLAWPKPKMEPPEDETVFAKMLQEGAPGVVGSATDSEGLMPPDPPKRRKGDRSKDPLSHLPGWFKSLLALGAAIAIGALLNEKALQWTRLEQAQQDAPGKYTQRLGERLAMEEAHSRSMDQQLGQIFQQLAVDRAEAKRRAELDAKEQVEIKVLLAETLAQVKLLSHQVEKATTR